MKSSLSLSLLALVVTSTVSLPAAPQPVGAASHPVGAVERHGIATIKAGNTMAEVQQALGAPACRLAAHVWVYHNFCGGEAQAPGDDCSLLVVMFADGRVNTLQLVNEPAMAILTRHFAVLKSGRAPAAFALAR